MKMGLGNDQSRILFHRCVLLDWRRLGQTNPAVPNESLMLELSGNGQPPISSSAP